MLHHRSNHLIVPIIGNALPLPNDPEALSSWVEGGCRVGVGVGVRQTGE